MKIVKDMLLNLAVIVAIIILFGLIICFIWNTAFVWLIPALGQITFESSLGLAAFFVIINNLATFWTWRIIEFKKVKAMETLRVAKSLSKQLVLVQAILVEKGIITELDKKIIESFGEEDIV